MFTSATIRSERANIVEFNILNAFDHPVKRCWIMLTQLFSCSQVSKTCWIRLATSQTCIQQCLNNIESVCPTPPTVWRLTHNHILEVALKSFFDRARANDASFGNLRARDDASSCKKWKVCNATQILPLEQLSSSSSEKKFLLDTFFWLLSIHKYWNTIMVHASVTMFL